jgi:hypothetical protein
MRAINTTSYGEMHPSASVRPRFEGHSFFPRITLLFLMPFLQLRQIPPQALKPRRPEVSVLVEQNFSSLGLAYRK